MTPRGHSSNEDWYFRLMAAHRRGLVRHWPLVLVAFGAAVAIGLASDDRSAPHTAPSPTYAAAVK
jgi:hypothetical protein